MNLFGPQQQGLRMPTGPSLGLQAQGGQGFQIPQGMTQQANAGILADLQRRMQGGMNPMALMQLMRAGQGMLQQPQQPLPQPYRAPLTQATPYAPRWRQSLFSSG